MSKNINQNSLDILIFAAVAFISYHTEKIDLYSAYLILTFAFALVLRFKSYNNQINEENVKHANTLAQRLIALGVIILSAVFYNIYDHYVFSFNAQSKIAEVTAVKEQLCSYTSGRRRSRTTREYQCWDIKYKIGDKEFDKNKVDRSMIQVGKKFNVNILIAKNGEYQQKFEDPIIDRSQYFWYGFSFYTPFFLFYSIYRVVLGLLISKIVRNRSKRPIRESAMNKMETSFIFYKINNQEFGPTSLSDVVLKIKNGQLGIKTEIRNIESNVYYPFDEYFRNIAKSGVEGNSPNTDITTAGIPPLRPGQVSQNIAKKAFIVSPKFIVTLAAIAAGSVLYIYNPYLLSDAQELWRKDSKKIDQNVLEKTSSIANNKPSLTEADKGDEVLKSLENKFKADSLANRKIVQTYLKELDLYRSDVDGLWGSSTRSGLVTYASAKNIPNDYITIKSSLANDHRLKTDSVIYKISLINIEEGYNLLNTQKKNSIIYQLKELGHIKDNFESIPPSEIIKALHRYKIAKNLNSDINIIIESLNKEKPTPRWVKSGLQKPKEVTTRILHKEPDENIIMAKFSVETPKGLNYYIKLKEKISGLDYLKILVRGGDIFTAEVKVGVYEMVYATGEEWYGENDLFGPEGQFYKSDQNLVFDIKDNVIRGKVVRLFKVVDGNMKTKKINPKDF